MILLLAAVSVVTFTLVSISPIDPLQANVGQTALGSMSEEQIEKLILLGCGHPAARTVSELGKRFRKRRYGSFTPVSPVCV